MQVRRSVRGLGQAAHFSTTPASRWWDWTRLTAWFSPTRPAEPSTHHAVEPETCVFVDGNNLLYAKYSPTCTQTLSNGVAIGATLGFLQELSHVMEKMHPHRLCVFFDTPVITHRKKNDPTYKANRDRMDDALRRQFPLTISLMQDFAVPVVQVPGIEADDMIASYTKASIESGYEVVIVSNDSDFFQLVRSAPPRVSLYKFRTRWWMEQDDVLQLIGGESPKLHPDLRALRGDQWGKSPGLPGGISKELAVDLVVRAGGLLPLLDHLDHVEDDALRRRLLDARDMLTRAFHASKLDDSMPLSTPLQNMSIRRINLAKLADMLGNPAAHFQSLVQKV